VANGCQGFLAGRALWQEFGEYLQEKRHDFFQIVVKQRFAEIAKITIR
jgi:tagatose-1,6-bisphosphate aldolase